MSMSVSYLFPHPLPLAGYSLVTTEGVDGVEALGLGGPAAYRAIWLEESRLWDWGTEGVAAYSSRRCEDNHIPGQGVGGLDSLLIGYTLDLLDPPICRNDGDVLNRPWVGVQGAEPVAHRHLI